MNELTLVAIGIIVYTEIFPTISAVFELVRTVIGYGISKINLSIAKIQAQINSLSNDQEESNENAIGFQIYNNEIEEGEE